MSLYATLQENTHLPGQYIPDFRQIMKTEKKYPQLYGVFCPPDSQSPDADTFNGIIAAEARVDARRIREMADRRPIRLLAAGGLTERASFIALTAEIDVTPVFPVHISNPPLTGGDILRLTSEFIRPDIEAAFVVVLGSREDAFLFLEVVLRDVFSRQDIHPMQIEIMIEPGWKIDMQTGMIRCLNNAETPVA